MFLINPSRRKFLKITMAILLLPFASQPLFAGTNETLSLKISRDGKHYDIAFAQNGSILEDGYFQLCHIFKDTQAGAAVKMDPELFAILARGQKWLSSYGYDGALVITSAYRTIETNSHTEGAAKDSLHMYGKAVDLKYPGLPITYLATLFRTYGAAGIGIYPTFLHIDTWKERVWRG